MPAARRSRLLLLVITLIASVQITGCAGAPVQEMSNARQAVRAADQADAARYAPDLFAEAQRLLKLAQTNISRGNYRESREYALQARDKAIEAREAALQAAGKKP